MRPTRSLSQIGTLLALLAAAFVLAGSAAVLSAPAEAQSTQCLASAPTLDEAKDAYATQCTVPRADCDPLNGGWTCSSDVIGDAAPGGLSPTNPPTPDPTSPPLPEPTTPATPEPTSPPASECVATGATLGQAKSAYAAACTAPRADCDPLDDSWTCSSGIIGNGAPGQDTSTNPTPSPTPDPTPDVTPTPTPTGPGANGCQPNTSGQVNLANDLISLHYDHAPDRDDGHATAAGKEVATALGFTPWVIGGAYGADNGNTYRSDSEVVMDAVWGSGNWVNADANWNTAVERTANRWQSILENCGDIWIAEGGQSDLSADVVRELKQRIPDLDTNARIHLIQHSQWNENQAGDADLAYVKATTDYIRIPDGNGGGNGTADFNQQDYTGPFNDSARTGPNGVGWDAAFAYFSPENERLDFSDTVELMKILGIGTDLVNNVEDFADRFIRSVVSDPVEPGATPDPEPNPEPEPEPVPEPTPDDPALLIAGDVVERTYPMTEGPNDNPMKGWNSGWSDDRPESTVGFQYIKWSDFEPTNGNFDFDAVEDVIGRSGSKDRHVILRLYCDWWGQDERSRGCPEWIYSDVGVNRIRGDNGRYITDYNDPRYVDQAIQAIEALAGRYDDDHRLYSFQLGLIGYWGEWHTWGSQIDGSPYEISPVTESQIIDAYLDSFDRVHVMGRQPWGPSLSATPGIGFHNDYFRPNNGHSAEFDEAVAASAMWQHGPIGGEMPPGLNSADFRDLYATPQGRRMIETGRYSTMKPTSDPGQFTDAYMSLHRRFGYNFQIESATYSASNPQGGEPGVALSVKNVGIAPFYYDWQVQFALLEDDGSVAALTEASAYDLRSTNPGDVLNLTGRLPVDRVPDGTYRLGVRILQPGADQPKPSQWKLDPRNTYILFANDLPVIESEWDGSNQLVGGWSILGQVSVG